MDSIEILKSIGKERNCIVWTELEMKKTRKVATDKYGDIIIKCIGVNKNGFKCNSYSMYGVHHCYHHFTIENGMTNNLHN